MKKLGELLEFDKCKLSQITHSLFSQTSKGSAAIVSALKSNNTESLHQLVTSQLDMLDLKVVTYDAVHNEVDQYLSVWEESTGYTDVDYVDDDTALDLSLLLKDYRDKCDSKLKQKSVDAIISFIQNNNASKADICKHRYGKDCYITEDIAQ